MESVREQALKRPFLEVRQGFRQIGAGVEGKLTGVMLRDFLA